MVEINFILGVGASLATIAAATISGIRYLGRSRVIEEAAHRLGVDLAALVIPDENPERCEFIKETFDPETIAAASEVVPFGMMLTNVGERAANENGIDSMIERAIEYDKLATRTERLGGHLSDEELEEIIDDRNLWPDPIERVVQLRDDSSVSYAWILSDEATEEDRASLASEIEQTFIETKANEPEALHFIVGNIDEIRELDAETVENYVKPWLKEREQGGGNS